MPTNYEQNQLEIPSYINPDGSFAYIDSKLLEYLPARLEDSKSFLRSNRTWRVAEICRNILFGQNKDLNLSRDFQVEINKLARQGQEMVGNAANIKPNFSIRTPKSAIAEEDKAITYEELKDHWWYSQGVDSVFKEGISEAASGIGYIFLWPEKDPNTDEIEIVPHAKSFKEVFPYGIGQDNDLDKAYSVTIWCETPLSEFKEKHPELANVITQDRNAPSYMSGRFKKAKDMARGIKASLRRGIEKRTDTILDPSFPMVDVFYTFTRDKTINESGKVIRMGTLLEGDLAGHDSYEVPSYEPGVNSGKDCLLFPYGRRLTIWTKSFIIFDGAPKWLCNSVPVAPLRFRKIPKEYIGSPILNNGRSLEDAINKMMNSIIERFDGLARFPIGIDKDSIPPQVIKLLEKRGIKGLIGKAIKMSFRVANKPIQALFDRELFNVDNKEFEIIKSLMELQDYQIGTNDFSNMQRKNQLPAADTQEALIQNLGVLSVDHERELSLGILRFGKIWLQFAPQVYTLRKRITIGGANLIDLKDLDYDPESLVEFPSLDPKFNSEPYWKRLKKHLSRYNLFAVPGSFQERQSITAKLTLLQLLGKGVAISDRRLYDTLVADEKYEETRLQWEEEQMFKAKLAAKIRAEVEQIAPSINSPEGGGLAQQVMQFLSQQNSLGEGRPSSDASSPRQEIKSDENGSRAVTATYQKN